MRRVGGWRCLGAIVALTAAALFLWVPFAGAGQRAEARHPKVLRATFRSFPDYMDPALSYTAEGWVAMWNSYIPLLTYKHAEGLAGSEVIPGLAKSLPKVTNHGKTYTLFLRHGLRYSDGERVRASDFEYAVERTFRLNSGGSPFYTDIVGAKRFWKKRRGRISGIVTNDSTGKIVIHLRRPSGIFSNELALMLVAPVPQSTPLRDQSAHPPPATGPYVITNSRPGIGWTYARNPEWKRRNGKLMPQLPAGHVGQIEVKVVRDEEAQAIDVEQGKFDWMQNPPSAARWARLLDKYEGTQFKVDPTISTYYFWMNMRKPPFSDLKVRQAVNYAIDADALQSVYAGQIAPTHQILPPDMPGYQQYNLYPHDMEKARQLIREAQPTDRKITVWTDSEAPNKEAGEYYRSVLRELGFDARLKIVNADFYFTVIGDTSTPNLDTGWSNWFEDYPHPSDWFLPLLAGSSILPTYNGNFSQVDIPPLNAEIARLQRSPLGPGQEVRYAALDRNYMDQAPWVPYGTRLLSTFVSNRIDLGKVIWNPTFGADLTSFQFK